MATLDKYLKLKGKNKDLYFIQKRIPKKLQFIFSYDVMNRSLETSDIRVARQRRDEILLGLEQLEDRLIQGEFDIMLNKFEQLDKETLDHVRDRFVDQLSSEYAWYGHPEQGDNPDPPEEDMAMLDAMNTALGSERPEKYPYTLTTCMEANFTYRPDYVNSTLLAHRKAVSRFNEFMGTEDIKVRDIKRKHVRNFKKHLETFIKSNGTIQRHFSDLSVIWQFGRDEEELTIGNPFEKHRIKVSATRKSYLAWHPDDLRKVIPELTSKHFDPLWVYIAWYTGSRLGEVFSIRPDDIYQDDESKVWVVSIKPDREELDYISKLDASAKTENARRIVPVHDDLYDPLMEFKQSNIGWDRPTSQSYSKMFGRRKYLIKDPINKPSIRYVFHSIRKNTATNFDRAGVEERLAARLVGHSTVGATMTYGYYSEGDDFKTALETINKLPTL